MELSIEQKQNLARLAILRQLAHRVGDLYGMELRAELRKIGRTGKRVEKANVIATAAAMERVDTIISMGIITEGKTPDFTLVPDAADICNFQHLLADLCPDSWKLLEVVDTMKPTDACRDAVSLALVPAVPRPLPEFEPIDDMAARAMLEERRVGHDEADA